MASEQGAGKREEAAVLERVQDFLRNNPDQAFRIPSWTMRYWTNAEVAAFALTEIARAKRETMEECTVICAQMAEHFGRSYQADGAIAVAAAIRRKMAEMGEK